MRPHQVLSVRGIGSTTLFRPADAPRTREGLCLNRNKTAQRFCRARRIDVRSIRSRRRGLRPSSVTRSTRHSSKSCRSFSKPQRSKREQSGWVLISRSTSLASVASPRAIEPNTRTSSAAAFRQPKNVGASFRELAQVHHRALMPVATFAARNSEIALSSTGLVPVNRGLRFQSDSKSARLIPSCWAC